METAQFVIALLALIATVVIALIAGWYHVSNSISKKFEELEKKYDEKDEAIKTLFFTRLDSIKKGANDTFVRIDSFKDYKENMTKELDLRLTTMMQILTVKFEGTEKAIQKFESFIKDNFTNHIK